MSLRFRNVQRPPTGGGCSGKIATTKIDELSADEMAEALEKQGTDPSFLLEEE